MEPYFIMTSKCIAGVFGAVLASLAVGCAAVTEGAGSETLAETSDGLGCDTSGTRFYVPPPNPGAKDQIKALKAAHQKGEAALIKQLIETPHAVWLTGGTANPGSQWNHSCADGW